MYLGSISSVLFHKVVSLCREYSRQIATPSKWLVDDHFGQSRIVSPSHCFCMEMQKFVIFASFANHSYILHGKSREDIMVSWEVAPLMRHMLQMYFRRYPHNYLWEPKHLSVACR